MTVRTNVTAPHSRRSTAQFTSRRFYLDPDWAIRPDSFRPPPRVPLPTSTMRCVWRRGFRGGAISKAASLPRSARDISPHPRLEIVIQTLPSGRIHSGRHPASSFHSPPGDVCGGAGSAGKQSVRPHPCRAPRATSVLTRALKIVVAGCAFLFLLLALVQEPDEVLRPRERFPTLREEVLDRIWRSGCW